MSALQLTMLALNFSLTPSAGDRNPIKPKPAQTSHTPFEILKARGAREITHEEYEQMRRDLEG